MKLLLTSAGIQNESLAKSFQDLAGKNRSEIKIGFIPTAANGEPGNKDWFINQYTNLYTYGFTWIDVIDFSAHNVPWEERLAECDAVVVSGGNTFHLLNEVRESGFDLWLKKNIDEKVYVGISAGSILVTPTIKIATVEPADINSIGLEDLTGLGYVDFEVSPHSPEVLTYQSNESYGAKTNNKLYAIDDSTGIMVVDGQVTVVTEGEWKEYN